VLKTLAVFTSLLFIICVLVSWGGKVQSPKPKVE